MKIAVCIKQVPDTEARLRVRKDGLGIDEEELPLVINDRGRSRTKRSAGRLRRTSFPLARSSVITPPTES